MPEAPSHHPETDLVHTFFSFMRQTTVETFPPAEVKPLESAKHVGGALSRK